MISAQVRFFDQTLAYMLRTRSVADVAVVRQWQSAITAVTPVTFDVPMEFLTGLTRPKQLDWSGIRVGSPAEAGRIMELYDLGARSVSLLLDVSAVSHPPAALTETLQAAGRRGMDISIRVVDLAACPSHDMPALYRLIQDYSVHTIIVDDLYSRGDPLSTCRMLEALRRHVHCLVEYHGHNQMGLATGNAIGAIRAGVHCVAAAVGGLGGYPALEEVLMAMRHLLGLTVVIPAKLAGLCETILQQVGHTVSPTKPIIGSGIFAHESGIHVDGVNKKSELYEPFSPESVGLSRKIVIGKHSGTAAIAVKLREFQIELKPVAVQEVLEQVRILAVRQKAPVSDLQLQELIREVSP